MRGLRLLLVAIAAFALMPLAATGSGLAQDLKKYPPTNTVKPTRTVKPPKGRPPTSTLPFTGGELAAFALIGAGAVGSGVVIVRRTRRRD